jgi:Na+-transporting methylmalonyl-CoA/oxaloacetate decarboxylase gamma subunit
MRLDKLLDKQIRMLVKFLGMSFWILVILILILWFSDNKEKFFPKRMVPNVPNPVNPFR